MRAFVSLFLALLMLCLPIVNATAISNIIVTPQSNAAIVTWQTDVPATSVVRFGLDSLSSLSQDSALNTTHTIVLPNLLAFRTYQLEVESSDAAAVKDFESGNFTTLHSAPPQKVTGLVSTSVTTTSVGLSWTASSENDVVTYKVYRNSQVVGNTSGTIFTETGLASGQTILYQVAAFDLDFNEGPKSDPVFVTTPQPDTTPPQITGISVVKGNATLIQWNTHEPSSSQVGFGITLALGSNAGQNDSVTAHSVLLSGLSPDVRVFFRVESCDASGNCAQSDIANFMPGLDVTPPTFTADIPALVNKALIEVSGTSEPGAFMQIFVDGVPRGAITAVPTDGKFRFDRVGLDISKTVNVLRIIARDDSNNLAEKTFSVGVDVAIPDLFVAPLPPSLNKQEIEVNGTVNENASIFFYVQDASTPVEPTKVSGLVLNDTALNWDAQLGVAGYIVYREDVGAIAKTTQPTYTDVSASGGVPFVYRVSAMSNHCFESVQSDPLSVTLSGTDVKIPPQKMVVDCAEFAQTRLDLVPTNGVASFKQLISLPEGTSTVTIEAVDNAGNKASERFDIFADSSAPVFNAINLNSLTPSYTCQEIVRGTLDSPATVELYLNNQPIPFSTVQTDDTNSFELPVTLSRDVSLEITVGDGTPNSPDTTTLFGVGDKAWNNKVKVVARDAAGNTIFEEGVIQCSLCGLGSEWAITTSTPMPNELTPQLIMEGFAQIGLTYELRWNGLGEQPTIHQVDVEIPPLSDEARERFDEEWIRNPIMVHKAPNGPDKGYIQVNLNRNDPIGPDEVDGTPRRYYERELNLSQHNMGGCDLPGSGCFKVPLMMTIEYGETTDNLVGGGLQKQCWDTQVFIQPPAFDPDKIPKELLNSTIQAIDATLGLINQTLTLVEPVTKYTTISCFVSMAATWGKYFTDELSCLGVDEAKCECSPEGDCRGNDECQQCFDARAQTKGLEDIQHYLCDRIFCPSVPTYEHYVKEKKESVKSHCEGYVAQLDDYGEVKECASLGVPPLSEKKTDCCITEYAKRWDPGILGGDEVKMSECMRIKDDPTQQEKYQAECGGFTEAFNTVADFSLCGAQTDNNLRYYPTGKKQKLQDVEKELWYVLDPEQRKIWESTIDRQGTIDRQTGKVLDKEEVLQDMEGAIVVFPKDDLEKACTKESMKIAKDGGLPREAVEVVCAGHMPKEFIADPASGLLRSIQAVCLSALTAYLRHYQQVLSLVKACFQTIMLTGEGSAGVCQALISNYVCDLIYELIRCVQPPTGEGAGVDYEGFGGVARAMSQATANIKESVTERYGRTSLYNALFVQKKLIHSICLAAFTGDWDIDWDAIVAQATKIQIESTVAVPLANRRFVAFNPAVGLARHVYEVGLVVVSGSEMNYNVRIVCSNAVTCNHPGSQGQCDCFGTEEKALDVTNRFGLGRLAQGETLDVAPLIRVGPEDPGMLSASKVRYDKVIVEYRYLNNNQEMVVKTVERPIDPIGGDPPAQCKFVLTVGFLCQVFTDEDGVAFFEKIPTPAYPTNQVAQGTPGFFRVGDPLKLDTQIIVLPGSAVSQQETSGIFDTVPQGSQKFAKIQVFNQNGIMVMDRYYPLSSMTSDSKRFIPDYSITKGHIEQKSSGRTECTALPIDGKTQLSMGRVFSISPLNRALRIQKTFDVVDGKNVDAYNVCEVAVPDLGTAPNVKKSLASMPACIKAEAKAVPVGGLINYLGEFAINEPQNVQPNDATVVMLCPAVRPEAGGACSLSDNQWKIKFSLHGSENGAPVNTPEYYDGKPQEVEVPVNVRCEVGGNAKVCTANVESVLNEECQCAGVSGMSTCGVGSYCCPTNGAHPGCQTAVDCSGNPFVLSFSEDSEDHDENDFIPTQQLRGTDPVVTDAECAAIAHEPTEVRSSMPLSEREAIFGNLVFANENGNSFSGSLVTDGVATELIEMDFMGWKIPVDGNKGGIHKKLYGNIKCVEKEIQRSCSAQDASYTVKFISSRRNENTVKSGVSYHVTGNAMDINGKTPPYWRDGGTGNLDCRPSTMRNAPAGFVQKCNTQPYDIPLCWITSFHKYGFNWLGVPIQTDRGLIGKSVKDYMHFEFTGNVNKLLPLTDVDSAPNTVPIGPITEVKNRIVEVTLAQRSAWNGGALKEGDPAAEQSLRAYYTAGNCNANAYMTPQDGDVTTHWSAAFISYVMAQAGVTGFPANCGHSSYFSAIRNNPGTCAAHPASEMTNVQPGDIVCRCSGSTCDFNFVHPQSTPVAHCDIVTERNNNDLVIMGGNLGDTVGSMTATTAIHSQGPWIGYISCGT